VAYEAKRYAKGKSITPTGRINYRRHEPTWGDVSFLLNAIPGLNTSNMTELMLGFGVSLAGPEHLQIVRNACAHIDKESMADVRSISSYYVGKSLKHPVEIIWWLAPSNKTDAIFTWLDDLEIIANLVTE